MIECDMWSTYYLCLLKVLCYVSFYIVNLDKRKNLDEKL